MLTLTLSDKNFNPRPSVRGDVDEYAPLIISANFNPRPSVRGDGGIVWRRITHPGNFNPRPSVRGDIILGGAADG